MGDPDGTSGRKLDLVGSVSLGTGVMIGAGIFALVGQVAGLAGDWFPVAFVVGALVAGASAYSYARYSSVHPSSGGVAMLLKDAYGPGVAAGSFSLFMYVSMVLAESLLARTFGTYVLRPFGLEDSALLVPALGVAVIAAAALLNLAGNRTVEGISAVAAAIKVLGIAALAIAGLIGVAVSGDADRVEPAAPTGGVFGVLAGATLCVLAYKGFTTITNQGDDLRDPERNIPRSIAISILVCAVVYVLISLSVGLTLGAGGAVDARDYSLAQAADPLFGAWGVGITVAVAAVATVSGLLASLYAVTRLYSMLEDMHQVPSLPDAVHRRPLVITAGLAIVVTAFFDLAQVAAVGAFLYLSMDLAVQWGVLRRLRSRIHAVAWWPIATIALDAAVLIPFLVLKAVSAPLVMAGAALVAAMIVVGQVIAVRRRGRHERSPSAGLPGGG